MNFLGEVRKKIPRIILKEKIWRIQFAPVVYNVTNGKGDIEKKATTFRTNRTTTNARYRHAHCNILSNIYIYIFFERLHTGHTENFIHLHTNTCTKKIGIWNRNYIFQQTITTDSHMHICKAVSMQQTTNERKNVRVEEGK